METKDIFIIGFVIIFVGFRLYQKFYKKDAGKGNTSMGKSVTPGSAFPSSSKDDDYEPYSKK
jgi:hypothetical protein